MTAGTILLIGEDASGVGALGDSLREAGFQVAAAPAAEAALAALAAVPHPPHPRPALILLALPDLATPAGRELARRLCREGGAPVVALGAQGTEGEAIAALDAGATDYLRRPYRHAEVVARVRAVLRRSCALTSPSPQLPGGQGPSPPLSHRERGESLVAGAPPASPLRPLHPAGG